MSTASATGRRVSRYGDDPSALVQAYRSERDDAARERLVELHMPLVRALAHRYVNRGERFEDLVQVGSVGLIEAIDRFDPERGEDFTSFAIPTITGAIRHHLRDRAAVVRIPRRLAETGRVRTPLTLSTNDDTAANVDPALTIEGAYASSDDRLMLVAGLRTLALRERRIMHLRFFAGLSQAEIAQQVGLSQVQVSRLIRASLVQVRAAIGADRPRALTRSVDGI